MEALVLSASYVTSPIQSYVEENICETSFAGRQEPISTLFKYAIKRTENL
jgi:hypothetical protein